MKKFTQWVDVIREAEERQQSELQKSYKDYFSAKLNKFGAKSPADLDAAQKSEFFEEIKKDWEKGTGAKPAGKKDLGIHESEDLNESAIFEADIKNAADFKEYATTVLKKQHGDKFDEKVADKVIKGLSDEAEKSGDWGAAVGKLNA